MTKLFSFVLELFTREPKKTPIKPLSTMEDYAESMAIYEKYLKCREDLIDNEDQSRRQLDQLILASEI